MRFWTKKRKLNYITASFFALFIGLLFTDGYITLEQEGDNYFHVYINNQEVGVVGDPEVAEELFVKARREIARGSEELTFIDADMTIRGEEVFWGELDDEKELQKRIKASLEENVMKTMQRSYTMKVNEYVVNLGSVDQVRELLQTAVDKYDTERKFVVELSRENGREFSMLTANVMKRESLAENVDNAHVSGGVDAILAKKPENVMEGFEKRFEDYELGLMDVRFSEEVEIVEAYLPEESISTLEEAVDNVIKEQETPGEYTIKAGDTLSEISIKLNIPIEKIVELNHDKLEDAGSMIHQGDKLIITIPEPELSVERLEKNYYEEIYDAETIFILNDEWYTNQTKVHQQPSAGFRRIVADVSYVNDKEVSRNILKEEVVMAAVPKIVERGTKIPPTYIKPISGGRLSSGFGKRTAPKKGASTYHKGIDWAIPTGTSVYASCGGTVSKAGWGSGYGYVVYIDHEDGRQTRYGHLSKVLVKTGQKVNQGERIALSGNTGVSTGPHLHFEILISGSQVNPLKYIQ